MTGTQRRTAGLGTRFALCLLAGVLSIAATASVASAQVESQPAMVEPELQDIGLLFTQTTTSGSLRPLKGKGSDRFVLTLKSPGRQVIWFQDRPGRQSGSIPIGGFVKGWDGFGFADDPPNVALSVLDAANDEDTAILTLGEPRYDAAKRKLRYPVRTESDATGNLAHFEHVHDPGAIRRFGRAALFIDDGSGYVIDGCVIQPYTHCSKPDFTGAHLSSWDLSNSIIDSPNFTQAHLIGTDLDNSELYNANFTDANVTFAGLQHTMLDGANFTDANVTGTDFSYAYLYGVNFTGANLGSGVDAAIFCQTKMPDGSTNNDGC